MSYSSTMRYTGMSGIDTASMVTQLMEAEAMKKNSVYRQRQILQYTQDAYRSVSDNVRSFQNNFFSFTSTSTIFNMRSSSTFGQNTTKITGGDGEEISSTKGKITASSSVSPGDYNFKVNSVASNEKRVGGSITSNTKLDVDLTGNKLDDTDSFDVTLNGVTRSIDFSNYTGANDKERLQNALDDNFGTGKITVADDGISVSAGSTLQISEGSIKSESAVFGSGLPDTMTTVNPTRFYSSITVPETMTSDISHKYTFKDTNGDEHEINIDLKAEDFTDGEITRDDYLSALNDELKSKNIIVAGEEGKLDDKGRIYFDNNNKIDTINGNALKDANVESFEVNGQSIEVVKMNDMTKAQYIQEINNSLKNEGFTAITASEDSDTGGVKFTVTKATNESYDINFDGDGDGNLDGTVTLQPTSSLQDLGITSGESTAISTDDTLADTLGITGSGTLNINGVDIDYDETTTLKQFMSSVNNSSAQVKLSFSETTGKFSLEGEESGAINAIKISGDTDVLDTMQLTGGNYTEVKTAADTEIEYDGITLTRESTTVEIDGITLDLNANSVGEEFNVNVEKDTGNTKDAIMKFVESYNSLVEGLQSEIKTSRPKSDSYSYFEPLTEDERSAMSETEQEQWDEKAKQGMLYGDSLLRRFTSELRSITYDKVELADGTKLSLQDLGITTGDYTEGGKLVIDTEKLEAGIEKYGDDIGTLFTKSETGIAEKMNDAIDDAFGTRGYVTEKAGRENTVTVNENTLSKAITRKDDELAELATYLINKENYYYSMFSAMEQVIIQANNEMSYLMSM